MGLEYQSLLQRLNSLVNVSKSQQNKAFKQHFVHPNIEGGLGSN